MSATDDPVIAVARATRAQRGMWAGVLVVLALISAIVGVVGWQATKPSELSSSAQGAANSLDCLTSGVGCNATVPGADPL
jgi:hypothetical protein